MLNQLHRLFHPLSSGFDPVPATYAREYAAGEYKLIDAPEHGVALINELLDHIGPISNKRVLDLGAGPGQYSIAFAQRGASVTWHDISRNYRDIAMQKAQKAGVEIAFSLGYMEEAASFPPFDLVFSRVCWRYCMSDRRFAAIVWNLIARGGWAYILEESLETTLRRPLGIKLGHVRPSRGMIERLFHKVAPEAVIHADYSLNVEQIFVHRQG